MIYFHFFITFIELFNEIDLKEENKTTGSSTMSPAVEFAVNYHQWILLKFMPFIHGNILEIGTGKGFYKKSIHTSGYFVSIDNEENIIKHTKELDPDGLYYFADISDKSTLNVIKQSSFQTILCFNVLEHIEEDEKALGNMLYLLEENGYLIIFVPAFRTFPCFPELPRRDELWIRLPLVIRSASRMTRIWSAPPRTATWPRSSPWSSAMSAGSTD